MVDVESQLAGLPILKREDALERMDFDETLYGEIAALFLEDTPLQLSILRQAFERQELSTATRQAHSIKSSAANVGGLRLAAVCYVMEKAGRGGQLDTMMQLTPLMERELTALMEQLR